MTIISDTPTERIYSSAQEIATRIGVSARTVQRWVAEGRLPVSRPGGSRGRYFIPESALMEWVGKVGITSPAGMSG